MSELKEYCCETMAEHLNYRCEEHPDVFDCADNLIYRSADSGAYGIIIHDGGSSFSRISYCPWCGAKLPEKTR